MNELVIPGYPTLGYGGMVFLPLAAPVFAPGTPITISCPVTSRCTGDARVKVKVSIYEGSVWSGHGTKLREYTSLEQSMSPGSLATFTVNHTTVAGSIDRRDVGIEVQYWNGTAWVADGTWEGDDVYYVRAVEYAFEIGAPTVEET